jgi:hypothetical protein
VIDNLTGYAVIFGIPAVGGFVLPRLVRRAAGAIAAIAAIALWFAGLNVHTGSALMYFLCVGLVMGVSLREFAGVLAGLSRVSAKRRVGNARHG